MSDGAMPGRTPALVGKLAADLGLQGTDEIAFADALLTIRRPFDAMQEAASTAFGGYLVQRMEIPGVANLWYVDLEDSGTKTLIYDRERSRFVVDTVDAYIGKRRRASGRRTVCTCRGRR